MVVAMEVVVVAGAAVVGVVAGWSIAGGVGGSRGSGP